MHISFVVKGIFLKDLEPFLACYPTLFEKPMAMIAGYFPQKGQRSTMEKDT